MRKHIIAGGVLLLAATNAIIAQRLQEKVIDTVNMDLTVHPGDDFYQYASGAWVKNNPVPDKETRWGSFQVLRDFNINAVKSILENAASGKSPSAGNVSKTVGDFYRSGMDSTLINALGIDPLLPDLQRIQNMKSKAELMQQVAYMQSTGLGNPFFNFGITQDRKNPQEMIVSFSQGGLTLPDKDYYSKTDPRSVAIQNAFKKYMVDLFSLSGSSPEAALTMSNSVFEFEKLMANAQKSRTELRDAEKSYNKLTFAKFAADAPALDWLNFANYLRVGNQKNFVCNNPPYLQFVNQLVVSNSLATLKDYLKWQALASAAPYLSQPFQEASFAYTQVLSGQKIQTPRWQRVSTVTDRMLGDMLGQLYVAEYFKPEAKLRMDEMIKNLVRAFEIRINNLAWMSSDTKEKALAKLAAFTPKIGYPAVWRQYEGLEIKPTAYYQNIRNAAIWANNFDLDKLGKPIDRTRFGMTPPTVNAYYNATLNEIVFPAGILQFPFFDPIADDAFNYGGIGAVIGHEISHGFDDQGSKYDADGTLRNWWNENDRKRFDALTQKLIAQYDNYKVLDTIAVNGKLTLGENIGDLGGLNAALEAYKMTDEFKAAKHIDGFTPLQRFFLSWAQVWRNNTLPQTKAQLILTDTHSPGEYRTIGPLVNMDDWYQAFNVQPGNKLYILPDHRIKIW